MGSRLPRFLPNVCFRSFGPHSIARHNPLIEFRSFIDYHSHQLRVVERLQPLLQGLERRHALPDDQERAVHQSRPKVGIDDRQASVWNLRRSNRIGCVKCAKASASCAERRISEGRSQAFPLAETITPCQ